MTQQEINTLIAMEKRIIHPSSIITMPDPTKCRAFNLCSIDRTKNFIIDINRKTKTYVAPYKYAYQKRYTIDIILLRLDIGGRGHTNPDGTEVPEIHMHIWKVGYKDFWAKAVPGIFPDVNNLPETMKTFLQYCNVVNFSDFKFACQGGVC